MVRMWLKLEEEIIEGVEVIGILVRRRELKKCRKIKVAIFILVESC